MEFIKKLIRPTYFWVYRMRGYPSIELFTTTITAIQHEYNDVFTYELTKPGGLHQHAGYYAHVIAPNSHINNHDVRDMSLANAPHEDRLMITMDTQSNTRYKRKFRNAKVGDRVDMYAIKGDFTNDHLNSEQKTVYIAGGVGITAVRSLIANRIDSNWNLIYAGKGYAYADFWEQHGAKVNKVKRGTLFPAIDAQLDSAEQFYICGSGPFIEDVKQYLLSKGVAETSIKAEGFGS